MRAGGWNSMNPEVVVHRGLGGTVADLMLFDGAVCSQDVKMLFAIRLPTPMLTEYANRLSDSDQGSGLVSQAAHAMTSNICNEIKGLVTKHMSV